MKTFLLNTVKLGPNLTPVFLKCTQLGLTNTLTPPMSTSLKETIKNWLLLNSRQARLESIVEHTTDQFRTNSIWSVDVSQNFPLINITSKVFSEICYLKKILITWLKILIFYHFCATNKTAFSRKSDLFSQK